MQKIGGQVFSNKYLLPYLQTHLFDSVAAMLLIVVDMSWFSGLFSKCKQ